MEEIEIPEAIRESVELPQSRSPLIPLIIGIVFCLGMAGLAALWLLPAINQSTQKTVDNPIESASPKTPSKKSGSKTADPTLEPVPTPVESTSKKPQQVDLLGHLPYGVAPESELEPIAANGGLRMRSAATLKFQQMQAAAKAEGISLVPISAFRNAKTQEQLFFGVKEQRGQDAAKRAEVSAPPGYSEHHTGYAVDIGDGNAPTTNLEQEFANTAAFNWLKQNAVKYSFELSFPPDNKQGVSYEPWHWRFVGDRNSLETFYKVRN